MRPKSSPARLSLSPFAAACLLALAGCQSATTQGTNNSANRPAAQAAPAQTTAAPQGAQANAGRPAPAGASSAAGGSAASSSPSSPSAKPSDPCALLTADDIKFVQGEAATQIKPSRQDATEFAVSQCFYQTPTFTKSVSLELTERGASGKSVREFWREGVARYEERREAKNVRREKSGKPLAGPAATPVKGVGEEAYWIGTNANGTLYAFKKDRLLRVSIGGPDREAERLRKVKALAQKALARL